jgi:pimeloyl-ACP methyl ester carboxylesterase
MNALLMTMWNTKNKLGSENNIRQNVAVFSDSVNSVKEIFKVQRRPSKSEHRRTFSDAFSLHERPQRVNYSIGIIEWIIKATAKITGVAYDHINQLLFGGLDDRSFHEFVLSVGYPYEQHEVVTEDGYILPLDRIPRKGSDCHRVVYFQHGVLDTAYAWISGSTGELATNCAFATFNKGYDIFLGNFRGNRNMLHTNSSISSKDYWDFSVNEHGIYDMSAIVDNIRKIKIKEGVPEDKLEITLIAHSLGGASSMVYLVWKRKMNLPHYIKKAILLSPAGYHHKIPRFCKITGPIIEMTLAKMIYGVRLPSSALVALTAKIMQDLRKMPAARDLISFFMAQVVGGNLKESAFTRVGNLTFNMLHSGTSKKMFLHFWHMYKVGKFELYDYENEFQNWMHYGSSKPLNILDNYHLLDIPIHFIAGDDDTLIPPEDVIVQHEALKRHHPELSRFVCFEGFSHLHFTYSQNDNVIGYISEQLD